MADPAPKDEELVTVYNTVFDTMSSMASTKPGDSHHLALRAVYEKGKADANRPSEPPDR